MFDFSTLGKLLISIGVFVLIIGIIIVLAGKIPGIGRLPGDIYYRKGNFTFYFPLATSVIVSLLLSLILNLVLKK